MQNINFIQKLTLLSSENNEGLFDVFISDLQSNISTLNANTANILKKITVIVPNLTMANWLSDKITTKLAICSNIDFIQLNQLIFTLYLENHPQEEIFDFKNSTFIIFDYLCNSIHLSHPEFKTIKNYLYDDNQQLISHKAFQLAVQLANIFSEYVYLRTEELITRSLNNKLAKWQLIIWEHIIQKIASKKTYLDIYKYFMNTSQLTNINNQIYIFSLNNIYCSQLTIIQKISKFCQVNWYSLALSTHYYGDLLTSKAAAKLQQKVLNIDELTIDDLYLTDGNQLVANLGIQSREFIELLLTNDIFDSNFDLINPEFKIDNKSTLLQIIQHDIYEILNRIDKKFYLDTNLDCYTAPLLIAPTDQSIKVNVCHSRMREIQVMFNEIAKCLNSDPNLHINDFIVVAPDIDLYAPYIKAVFSNENIKLADGTLVHLPFNLNSKRFKPRIKILDTVKTILNTPYCLPVSFLFELINQADIQNNLDFKRSDIDLIYTWFIENNVRFGYDFKDYDIYSYKNYDIHGFKRFLMSLIIGFCIPHNIMQNNHIDNKNNTNNTHNKDKQVYQLENYNQYLPIYVVEENAYVGYDNLENSQRKLCTKLISLINLLVQLKEILYINNNNYRDIEITQYIELIEKIKNTLITDDNDSLIIDNFIGKLRTIKINSPINIIILNSIIDEYCMGFDINTVFNGKLICTSMHAVRNIPHKIVYILGMNNSEFPKKHTPDKLSLLAHEWIITDRNLTLDNKQLFLDLILMAQQKLYISYIGRNATNNKTIEPSNIVNIFLETIKNSVINSEEILNNIIQLHSLHPFYNNKFDNYSVFWGQLTNCIKDDVVNKSWDFQSNLQIDFTDKDFKDFLQPSLKDLINTLCYTNSNLYRILKIDTRTYNKELNDYENLFLLDKSIVTTLYKELSKFELSTLRKWFDSGELSKYLHLKGVINYDHIGDYQVEKIFTLYDKYMALHTNITQVDLNFHSSKYNIDITDKVFMDGNDLLIFPNFYEIPISNKQESRNSIKNHVNSIKTLAKCLVYSLVAKFATLTSQSGEIITIEKLYYIALDNKSNTYKYEIKFLDFSNTNNGTYNNLYNAQAHSLGNLLKFYKYSLSNPVLIHEKSIQAYIDSKPPNKPFEKARSTFEANFKNYGLDKLKSDPIIAGIADNYFNLCEELNLSNSIIEIGKLLKIIQLNEIK